MDLRTRTGRLAQPAPYGQLDLLYAERSHRLEAAERLLLPAGVSLEEVKKAPYVHLKDVIERINCTVILKGPCTYLGFPNGKTYFNFSPNDGMATGGVGDVLAGILGGLIGQEANLK